MKQVGGADAGTVQHSPLPRTEMWEPAAGNLPAPPVLPAPCPFCTLPEVTVRSLLTPRDHTLRAQPVPLGSPSVFLLLHFSGLLSHSPFGYFLLWNPF